MELFPLLTTGILYIFIWAWQRARRNSALPPGPPGDPLIGHLRIMPTENQAGVFHEWSKVYGDVMYLEVFGRKMVILGSIEAAQGILENRGANYSCRPKFTLFELMGWYPTLTFLQYGKRFQRMRKAIQSYFGKKESLALNYALAEEAHLLVKNLLNAGPGDHLSHLHRLTVSNIMRAAFGHQVKSDDDVFMGIGVRVTHALNNCGPAGNTSVDLFPWLQHFPSWFPGMHYVNLARTRWYKDIRELHDSSFDFAKAEMKTKTVQKSFTSDKLEALQDLKDVDPEEIEDIKGAAATLFAAGEDTTFITLSAFVLAMVQNPDIQRRAYEEIVSVVGEDRLPEIGDRERLPYLECILSETFRWHNAAPLGVPHRSLQDDVYNGMFIPKDTIVIANIRGMSRDERVYSDPSTFNPSRYMNGEPPSPSIWGFGRRICPGRYFADLAVWNVMACVLATLELFPTKDKMGREVMPEVVVTEGLTSGFAPFKFEVRPRSEKARALIVEIE